MFGKMRIGPGQWSRKGYNQSEASPKNILEQVLTREVSVGGLQLGRTLILPQVDETLDIFQGKWVCQRQWWKLPGYPGDQCWKMFHYWHILIIVYLRGKLWTWRPRIVMPMPWRNQYCCVEVLSFPSLYMCLSPLCEILCQLPFEQLSSLYNQMLEVPSQVTILHGASPITNKK